MTRYSENVSKWNDAPFSVQESYIARRSSPRPARSRRRRVRLLPVLLGLLLFLGGFLLGITRAAALPPKAEEQEEQPVAIVPESTESPLSPPDTPATQEETSWNLQLVSADHPLSEDFQAPELTELRNGHAIDSRAYPSLQQMMDDCRAAGLEPLICSSYRTYSKQEELFENKINSLLQQGYSSESAETEAARWVARPGTSEHETGLAVDIVDTSYQLLDQQQEQTPVQQWLMAHCAEYGFILRYPTDKSDLTGIGYEPWHYRYVGLEAAKEITEQGLCLEEYLGS